MMQVIIEAPNYMHPKLNPKPGKVVCCFGVTCAGTRVLELARLSDTRF